MMHFPRAAYINQIQEGITWLINKTRMKVLMSITPANICKMYEVIHHNMKRVVFKTLIHAM
jgi:hypothetical protein